MNSDWLRSFAVFAEHLNFTAAARRLHLSQPALHVQVRKLSEEVGRPLYRRDGRALLLTPVGRRLAAHARDVAERDQAVLEEVRGQVPSGSVVLASGQGAFLHLLGPVVSRFPKHRWPLRLRTLAGPETVEAVRDATAHLGVLATDAPPADLRAATLRAVGQQVVLPSAHRLARRRTLRPADLEGEALVAAPAGSPHRTMLGHLLRGLDWSVAVEASGWELMLHFARCGLGLTVVDDFCPAPPGMVAVPLEGAPSIAYHLIGRPGPRPPGVEALRRLVMEVAGAA
jgi:DNA-binding transcriptional LysR family regulator